ncbi:MAG: type IV secretion system VirB6 domain protein [Candidatus Xenolissoclinum pacificiensis L6]|uniref:Type IV secretion system VirB6 domain protein n=1 Tax=Candidatus Xenolissoclinum pacificiensis L6 TaxID=1401685 RepID=W2V113_9RICK|nr:MAG: type IV secretion system VirB6 domain protein [Candidatus Xenolissoclinum pacificiensis L6]
MKKYILISLLSIIFIQVDFMFQNYFFEDNSAYIANAADDIARSDMATNPVCGEAVAVQTVLVGLKLLVTTAIWMFQTGKWYVIAPAITLFVAAQVGVISCLYSFVRHPVYRDNEGGYLTCKDPVFIDTDDPYNPQQATCPSKQFNTDNKYNWQLNNAPHSEYIEVCNRLPIGGLRLPNPCSDESEYRKKCDSSGFLYCREYDHHKDAIEAKCFMGGPLVCVTLAPGENTWIHGMNFSAYDRGQDICVKLYYLPPFPVIGCHKKPPPPPKPMCANSIAIVDDVTGKVEAYDNSGCYSCYISSACHGSNMLYLHAKDPMSSIVIACVKETLDNLITGGNCLDPKTGERRKGVLEILNDRLLNITMLFITISVVLFGYKVLMQGTKGPSDVTVFIIKIVFVSFLTYSNVLPKMYNDIISLSSAISKIFIDNSGHGSAIWGRTLCTFGGENSNYNRPHLKAGVIMDSDESAIYSAILTDTTLSSIGDVQSNATVIASNAGVTEADVLAFTSNIFFKDYSYLAIWDTIDCKLGYYFGESMIPEAVVAGGLAKVGAVFLGTVGKVIILFGAFLFSGFIIPAVCMVVLSIFTIIFIITLIYMYILSLLVLLVLVIFAPLFIPMMLITVTKGYFDAWLKQIIAYSLQFIIFFAYMGLTFSVVDTMAFGDMEMVEIPTTLENTFYTNGQKQVVNRTYYSYQFKSYDDCAKEENKHALTCMMNYYGFSSGNFFLFDVIISFFNPDAGTVYSLTDLIISAMGMMLVMIIFSDFLQILGNIAAELSGSFRANIYSSVAKSPLFPRAVSAVQSVYGGTSAVADKAGHALRAGSRKATGYAKEKSKDKTREGIKSQQEVSRSMRGRDDD